MLTQCFECFHFQSEINLSQVFPWLQEKTLFGEAALVHNPKPGIDFTPADLARNLILASVLDRKLSEQEVCIMYHESFNLEMPVLLRSLKSNNVELG